MFKASAGFEQVAARYTKKVELPWGTRFGGILTPQYEDMVEPRDEEVDTEDPEEERIVYSYLFASGFAEPTVVQIVEIDDPGEGYTVVVEPLSGRVHLHGELLSHEGMFDDMPEEGPDLPN